MAIREDLVASAVSSEILFDLYIANQSTGYM